MRVAILLLAAVLSLPVLASAQARPSRAQVRQLLSGVEHVPSEHDWRRIGDGALPILIALYQDVDEPAYVRLRAIGATAAFPRPAVRTFLLAVATLEGQGDLYVREAISALGRAFGRDAIDAVAPFLDHPEPIVREGAALTLARVGGADDLLRARLRREGDAVVRQAIAASLAR